MLRKMLVHMEYICCYLSKYVKLSLQGEYIMDLLVVKLSEDYKSFIEHLRNAFINSTQCFYNTIGKNKDKYIEICDSLKHKKDFLNTVFIIHRDNEPLQAYLCKSQKIESNSNMICEDSIRTSEITLIKNFISDIEVDFENDFEKDVYMCYRNILSSSYLSFVNNISEPYVVKRKKPDEQSYEINDLEQGMELHFLAQKNEYCIRPIGIQGISKYRSEFQRDRERIVHTKAYRRLVDKAQIFTSNKGDHYRTRMTHTLEVSQIARGISLRLGLNPDLTEAISLGHDIGHTPFGHQGERTIDNILKGKIDIIPNVKKLDIGGFKHNYQSLRVLTFLEEKYVEHEGIDLSYQTLEGILKHTKCKKHDFDIGEFLINGEIEYLHLDADFPTTLEGQVVKIADEIAQRGHDLDDAFASGLLNLDSFKAFCQIDFMEPIINIVSEIEVKIAEYEEKRRIIIDKTDIMRAELVSKILALFISDLVENALKAMSDYKSRKANFFTNHHRVDEELIVFGGDGKNRIKYLEKIISKNVINSFEVSRFDSKAEFIVEALFKAYYKNPKLLPDGMIARLKKDAYRHGVSFVNFRDDVPQCVSDEIIEITQITDKQKNCHELAEEYENKRKVLARCIADHISGMTDNYALNEYSKLYESF